MIKYYYPIVDAMMYLASVVNEESAKALVADLEANKPDILAEATKILRPALDLEAELEKTLHLDGLNYDFYFQHDMHSRDLATSTSSAAFILLANLKECITETSGLDDVLALRHNLTRQERMSLFSSNDLVDQGNEDNRLQSIIERDDEQAFIAFLNSLKAPAPLRRKLVNLYQNFDEHVSKLIDLLRPVVDALTANESIYRDSVRRASQQISKITDLRKFIKERYGIVMPYFETYSPYITVSEPSSITVHAMDNIAPDIFIGACINDITTLLSNRRECSRLVTSFKALADDNRMDILHCLCTRPSYGLELAELLNISAPAVSYHMNKLALNGFVDIKLDGGKLYYTSNMDNIDAFLDSVKAFLRTPYFPKE